MKQRWFKRLTRRPAPQSDKPPDRADFAILIGLLVVAVLVVVGAIWATW